ncbi:MAG TPA: Hsp20/alpha crystallin family protein [Firmicutes bacterium]|nr:Hsp20/alpha crystallin family protein [Bacillota bacterium]
MTNLRIRRPDAPARRRTGFPFADFFDDPEFFPMFRWKDFEGMDQQSWVPRVDIIEQPESWTFKAELPDLKPENINITIEEGMLAIKGERKFEEEIKEGNYTRLERQYGSFERRFSLPSGIDQANIKADYKNGLLTLTVPKKEEAKPKSIKIDVS